VAAPVAVEAGTGVEVAAGLGLGVEEGGGGKYTNVFVGPGARAVFVPDARVAGGAGEVVAGAPTVGVVRAESAWVGNCVTPGKVAPGVR
jgi:hypothetical protein